MNHRIRKKKIKQKIQFPVTILNDREYSDEIYDYIKKKYPETEILHLSGYGYCFCLKNKYYHVFLSMLLASYTVYYCIELKNLTKDNYPEKSREIMNMITDMSRLQLLNNCLNKVGEIYARRD